LAFADDFRQLVDKFGLAKMVRFSVDIVVESSVFGQTDSTSGEIAVDQGGRYLAVFGDDRFLYDGKVIWEYVAENNQATRQVIGEEDTYKNPLAFLKNPEHYYRWQPVIADSIYMLHNRDREDDLLPDSMKVFLSDGQLRLIEYLDINSDLNRVFISDISLTDTIPPGFFRVSLPDSIQIITLP